MLIRCGMIENSLVMMHVWYVGDCCGKNMQTLLWLFDDDVVVMDDAYGAYTSYIYMIWCKWFCEDMVIDILFLYMMDDTWRHGICLVDAWKYMFLWWTWIEALPTKGKRKLTLIKSRGWGDSWSLQKILWCYILGHRLMILKLKCLILHIDDELLLLLSMVQILHSIWWLLKITLVVLPHCRGIWSWL